VGCEVDGLGGGGYLLGEGGPELVLAELGDVGFAEASGRFFEGGGSRVGEAAPRADILSCNTIGIPVIVYASPVTSVVIPSIHTSKTTTPLPPSTIRTTTRTTSHPTPHPTSSTTPPRLWWRWR